MHVDVRVAGIELSTLIDAVLAGEDVVIVRDSVPVVRLVPVRAKAFEFGLLSDRIYDGPDFLEPMSEQELRRWEGD